MKYIKQILLTLTVLVFLIGCFAFSVSATETEEMTLSFILDGITYTYSCSSDATWDDLNGAEFYVGDEQGTIEIVDGYVFLSVFTRDGTHYDYQLVSDPGEDLPWVLVTSDDALIVDTPYLLQIELVINVSGQDYPFYYPSYVKTWNDIVQLEQVYTHPELGKCSWLAVGDSESSGSVGLQFIDVDGRPVYFLWRNSLLTYCGNSINNTVGLSDRATLYYDARIQCVSHVCETIITKEPTCTDYGESISVCKLCGVKIATVSIPWIDHEWTEIKRQPATCAESGYILYQCFNCGNEHFDYLAALDHKYSYTTVKEPTCTEVGCSVAVCSDCGDEDQKELAALGHDYGLWNCSRCGSIRVVDWFDGDGDGTLGSSGPNPDSGVDVEDKKTLLDYLAGLLPGGGFGSGSSGSDEGIHTTLDGLARILSLGLALVLVLILFPLFKPLFELLGSLISNGVQALSSGIKSLSKKVKTYKKKVTNKK